MNTNTSTFYPKDLNSIINIYDFLSTYIDYYIDDKPLQEDELTDAQLLQQCLPALQRVITEMKRPKIISGSYNIIHMTEQDFKNQIYTAEKNARESVNPNYKYCIVDVNINKCFLTDDIGIAMEAAAMKSKNGSMWRVCKIYKSTDDGSYRTFIEGHCCDGHYYEDGREFLHFDYIAQCAEIMKL